MIIPSIDLQGGNAVQLVGGKTLEINAGDPRPIAERFRRVGEVAVVDLDAALGTGHNREVMRELVQMAPCRVGGGIRDVDTALEWLDAGASKVVLGTAARPEILKHLPRERVIAALDAVEGEVVVEGWQTRTGRSITERMKELREYVGGFLVTFVEKEGRMQGTDMARVRPLLDAAQGAQLTIAGGVTELHEITELDRLGAEAQIGMALYSGHMSLGDAFLAPLSTDRPDGLFSTLVVDEQGLALGLSYSSLESARAAIEQGKGIYHSRKRGLWVKGASSGATQELLKVSLDCDRDTLIFKVRQVGEGFCHKDTWTCWGERQGFPALLQRLQERKQHAPEGSYTARLFSDPELLKAKLVEEAIELAEATEPRHVAEEVADLVYFAMTAMTRADVSWSEVSDILDRRALKVSRRPGEAKAPILRSLNPSLSESDQ